MNKNILNSIFIFVLGVLVGKYLLPGRYFPLRQAHLVIPTKHLATSTTKHIDVEKDNFNETGFPIDVVPNIVHYVLFTVHEIEFVHFISMLSVLKNQKPQQIYIHCDCHQLNGDYYQRVLRVANKTNTPIIIRTIERPTQIFGKRLSEKWLNWHSADITRNRVLQEFGGIYLDRDVYVVKPLNVFFKYEMTVNWKEGQVLSISTMIGHKNARFLKLWLESYHDYQAERWYYNGGQLPTNSILIPRPYLVHRVKGQFGSDGPNICPMLYSSYNKNWEQDYYVIHLFMRATNVTYPDWCFKGKVPSIISFNETIVYSHPVTFSEMTKKLLEFEKQCF